MSPLSNTSTSCDEWVPFCENVHHSWTSASNLSGCLQRKDSYTALFVLFNSNLPIHACQLTRTERMTAAFDQFTLSHGSFQLSHPAIAWMHFTRTWLRYVRVFAIANPSVCNVCAPYSGVEAFGNILPLCTLAFSDLCANFLWRSSHGNHSVGCVKRKRGIKIDRFHVMQRTVLLSQFCPSVCLSDACIVWQN